MMVMVIMKMMLVRTDAICNDDVGCLANTAESSGLANKSLSHVFVEAEVKLRANLRIDVRSLKDLYEIKYTPTSLSPAGWCYRYYRALDHPPKHIIA